MKTALLEHSAVHHASQTETVPAPAPRPLLVATDASDSSDAAVRAARAIAVRTRQAVKLIAVHVPVPIATPEVQIPTTPAMDAQGRSDLRKRVRVQLGRLAIDGMWPFEVVSGDPATMIANTAQRIGASMVIMGLGGHGVLDRIFGDELVLRVLRLGTIPVLAVAPSFTGLPKRILAAMDFSASSVRALTLGAEVMQPNAVVTVAHVISPELDPVNWKGMHAGYQGTVGRAMDRVIAEAGFGEDMTVVRSILGGDPSRELHRVYEEMEPDLVVTGSHGHNFLTRLLLGSVSTRLIRKVACSVLVAPPVEGAAYMDELPIVPTQFACYEWAERLEEFSRRNSGRCAMLEEIDPEIGAQIQEMATPFVGAAFDPRHARVHLMFGSAEAGNARHFTRSIGGVTAVQLLRDRTGRDLLLRVAHGPAQTLLTLER